jgi:DNA transposition AAA+ family ATPase
VNTLTTKAPVGEAVGSPPNNGATPLATPGGINLGINLDRWKTLPDNISIELLWFHQWIIDHGIGWKEAAEAIHYDQSTVHRVLHGTYEGNWENIAAAIHGFKKLFEQRGSIQQNEFVENSISRLISAAFDYALANSSITLVIGESRTGKTIAAKAWAERNNHGRAVFVTAPVIGGIKALVHRICKPCGIHTKHHRSTMEFTEAIYRAFNKNRMIIVDEAHRLLPSDARSLNPPGLELLRDIRDETGCALALISTKRLPRGLEKGAYVHEQLVGRIGMPVLIKPKIKRADILPIVRQFVKNPGSALLDELDKIANAPGRLGIMVETLKVASRIASKSKQQLGEEHVRKAIAIRAQMSAGGNE